MIRRVQSGDADAIFRILEASHQFSRIPIGPHWTLSQVEEECAHPGWVSVSASGEVEAFILTRESEVASEVSFLATAPEARGQGRMRALLGHLIATRQSPLPIWLEVHEGNLAARELYESLGFQVVGKRPRYYADGGAAVLYNYG